MTPMVKFPSFIDADPFISPPKAKEPEAAGNDEAFEFDEKSFEA
jgi:hypothetical protein